MNVLLPRLVTRRVGGGPLAGYQTIQTLRYGSHAPTAPVDSKNQLSADVKNVSVATTSAPPLARMPLGILLRSAVLTTIMSTPILFKPCLAFMGAMVESKSALLNPDRNPVLNLLLRWTVYDHFCAGSTPAEVTKTVKGLKDVGFNGVIIGYAKEIVLGDNDEAQSGADLEKMQLGVVEQWKKGTLDTIAILAPGDILAIKFTGAGPIAVDALKDGNPMPPAIAAAMDEICAATASRGGRLWIDAEQQRIQHAIDDWTIQLMRKYNRDGRILVYNTIQGYLKGARDNVRRQIQLAGEEGWGLGIKLVRGAYIEHETRSLIHDTQEDTDQSYNDIAASLIEKRLPGGGGPLQETVQNYPHTALLLATHNRESVNKAFSLYQQRCASGQPGIVLECGQLQGMADDVSYGLVQKNQDHVASQQGQGQGTSPVPRVFKCLAWGSVPECLHFLYRRAIENRGAVTRTQSMADAMRGEVWRRLLRR